MPCVPKLFYNCSESRLKRDHKLCLHIVASAQTSCRVILQLVRVLQSEVCAAVRPLSNLRFVLRVLLLQEQASLDHLSSSLGTLIHIPVVPAGASIPRGVVHGYPEHAAQSQFDSLPTCGAHNIIPQMGALHDAAS